MGRSFKLFEVSGIDIRVHITFPLILLWAAFNFMMITGTFDGAIFGVIAISLLFVLVTLHELGHSFAAMYYGVPVEQIVLSPIGGVAQLQNMPEKPIQELVIAFAGPAVNFIIAGLMLGVAWLLQIDLLNPFLLLFNGGALSFAALFAYIFASNLLLALFNLIPAFPLDGGRVFRALLALFLPYVQATRFAATIGRIAAFALGLFGLFGNGGIFLVFIAFFIYIAAGQEVRYVEMREALRGFRVQELYSPAGYRLTPNHTLQQAYDLLVYTRQGNFPVTVDGRLVGFLTQADLMEALRTHRSYTPVAYVMRQDLPALSPRMNLFEAQQLMAELQVPVLPVVENGRFLGVLTLGHINEMANWLHMAPGAYTSRPGRPEGIDRLAERPL